LVGELEVAFHDVGQLFGPQYHVQRSGGSVGVTGFEVDLLLRSKPFRDRDERKSRNSYRLLRIVQISLQVYLFAAQISDEIEFRRRRTTEEMAMDSSISESRAMCRVFLVTKIRLSVQAWV
jgi:hypothetical protein